MTEKPKYIIPAGTPADALFEVNGKWDIVFHTDYNIIVSPGMWDESFSYWNHEHDLILNIEWDGYIRKFKVNRNYLIKVNS